MEILVDSINQSALPIYFLKIFHFLRGACNPYWTRPWVADRARPSIQGCQEEKKYNACSVSTLSERLQTASVLQVKRQFLTTALWPGNRFTRGYGQTQLAAPALFDTQFQNMKLTAHRTYSTLWGMQLKQYIGQAHFLHFDVREDRARL